MDHKIVFSKTGKGVLEIKNKAGKLSRELAKVLGLVDGKSSVADLIAKSKLSEADVGRVLKQLEERGYIKEFSNLSGAMSSAASSGSTSYVDDLDFTSQLAPGKRIYSSSQAEMRARESSEREQAEAEARRKREEAEQRKKNQAAQQAREEAARMARIEAERKAREAAALKSKQQTEMKAQQQAAEMKKTTRDLAKILEAERQALEKSDRQKKEIQARKAKEEAERRAREEAERKRREEVERKQREEEERKRRAEEERKRREEEERKRREEEERKRREEAERKRREEEERKRREEEERKRRAEEERKRREEEERKRREEEERKRREEEERKRLEEEERKRLEEEAERKRREEEAERKRAEEEQRKQREEEERRRRDEEERKRREEEDQRREEEDRRREEEDRRRAEEERKRREEDDDEERRRLEEEQDRRREEEDRRREEEDRRREEEEEEERKRREEEEEEERRGREEEEQQQAEASSGFDIGDFDLPSITDPDESATPNFDLPAADSESASNAESNVDLSSFDTESSESFTADFDRQQELRRKQEEEEERQREESENARIATERARREEEAREEAARRAAMEAEMRTRVELEKAERAERERAKEEEYKRKIEQEEERKRAEAAQREREEFERVEGERKKREEDLVRRRQQAEESDRKRAEIKALQKRGKIRSPMERARPFIIGVVGLVALLAGAIQVMPMAGYIPIIEKMISEQVGEPVTIGSMKMSVTSGFQFKLSNVNIGSTQDVTLSDVVATPELGSLFGDRLVLNSIQANGGTIVKEALARFPDWLEKSISEPRISVRKIMLRGIKLEMRSFALPTLNANVNFVKSGKINSATVETADGKLSVDITNVVGGAEVVIQANNWTAPIGAPVVLTDFTGSGTLRGSTLQLSEWDATVYGGQVKGTAQIAWTPRWRLSSQFEFVRVEAEEMLAAFSDTAKVTGSANGKGSFLAEAGSIDALLDRPSWTGSFTVKKGTVDGVDLVRALQAGSGGTQGGSTRFEELTGEVAISNGRYRYDNVRLSAGILSARSDFNISNNQDLSGRINVALRSPAQQLSANLNLSGTLKGPALRR